MFHYKLFVINFNMQNYSPPPELWSYTSLEDEGIVKIGLLTEKFLDEEGNTR